MTGMATKRSSSATTTAGSPEPAEPTEPATPAEELTTEVEVQGTGPDGQWRAETHGQSPAERPKSEF
jgi:hypothetical protein